MFERGGCDLKVGSVVTERRAEMSPAAGGRKIEEQNAVAIDGQNLVEPARKHRSKIWVLATLRRGRAWHHSRR